MVGLNWLHIQNFRNIQSVQLDLCPGLNLFVGPNGAGKTALLESVHALARGRSFRTNQTRTIISNGSEELIVRGGVQHNTAERTIGFRRFRSGKAEFRVDNQPERKLSTIARILPVQTVSTELSELVFGGPAERRQWLDWGLFHVEHSYLGLLQSYNQALKQRNALLKVQSPVAGGLDAPPLGAYDQYTSDSMRPKSDMSQPQGEGSQTRDDAPNSPGNDLGPWDAQVGQLGEQVSDFREKFGRLVYLRLQSVLADVAPTISVSFEYKRGWTEGISLAKTLGETHSRDVKLGYTGAGPHRGDLAIRSGDSGAAHFLSRGQGKLVAMSMVIALVEILQDKSTGAVLLIDDLGAELDQEHNERLFRRLQATGSQILATANQNPVGDWAFSDGEFRLFHVKQGAVEL